MANSQENERPGQEEGAVNIGLLGAMGYRSFNTLMNILEKGHWYLIGITIPYYSYQSITVLAGKETDADIEIGIKESLQQISEVIDRYMAGTIIVETLIIILLVIAILIMRKSLNRYKKKVGRLERGLIEPLDSDRQSSNLTETGSTNPGDKP